MKKVLLKVLIIAVILGAFAGCKSFGFGKGNGNGTGEDLNVNKSSVNVNVENVEKKEIDKNYEKVKKKSIVTIKVEETIIYIDDAECSDVNDMKDSISKLQAEDNTTKYEFVHDFAIKSTYDEVKRALYNLEETLNIDVIYND